MQELDSVIGNIYKSKEFYFEIDNTLSFSYDGKTEYVVNFNTDLLSVGLQVEEILQQAGFAPTVRGEQLSTEDYVKITNVMKQYI